MKVDVESYEVYKNLWAGAIHKPGYTFNTQPIFNALVTGLLEEGEVEICKNGDYCYVPEIACKPNGQLLTTQEAADVLSISRRAVLKACEAGTLKADKIGRDWLITTGAVTAYRKTYLRRPGRK
jgi:excisionase family DNA binding protein